MQKSAYCVFPESVVILLIKLDGFLGIICQLEPILVFGGMYIILDIKDIGNIYKLLRIIGEMTFLFPLGNVKDTIISCIYFKDELFIFLDDINSLQYIFYSIP